MENKICSEVTKSGGVGEMIFKKLSLVISLVFLSIVLVSCQQASDGGNQNNSIPKQNEETKDKITSVEEEKKIAELTEVWANALKTRDGKPRYEMMSEKAKEKFEQEQINRSGEDWNFNIGWSSPWVVSFDIEIEGMTANIVYAMKTSEPADYYMRETLTFVMENGKLVVDDYQTIDGLYIGHISIEKDTLYLDEVEWITVENQDRIKELELSQSDMPNGYYIYNPSTEKISFKIGDNTEYNFVAYESFSFIKEGEDRNYTTTKKEEFIEFLNYVKSDRVVFWVEVIDGFVVNITEQFIN